MAGMNRPLRAGETTRKLTDKEKRAMAYAIEKMDDGLHVTLLNEIGDDRSRFMIESYNSHYPVNRVAGQLKRRGCKILNTGKSRSKVIVFPAFIVSEESS